MHRVFSNLRFLFVGGLVFLASVAGTALAGKFNPTLNIGDVAPSWQDLPGVDDKNHSADELKDKDVIVVAFTCNSCPTAIDYEDRMIALAKQFSTTNQVALV